MSTEQQKPRWQDVNKAWSEFRDSALCASGVVVMVSGYETTTQYVLGDINEMGGQCDDCSAIRDDDVVLRVLDLRSVIAGALWEAA